jgi:hypothetical protein
MATGVTCRAVAVHEGGQRGVHVLPADGVQVTTRVHPAVEAAGHGEPPAGVGRVVEGTVGVHACHPAGHAVSRLVRGDSAGSHRAGDHPGVGGGDLAGGEGRGRRRQLLEPPSRRHRRHRLRRRHPAGAVQPAPHRHRAVAPVALPAVGRPHRRRQGGGDPVRRGTQRTDHVQQRVVGQLGEVGLGQAVEDGTQLGHWPLPRSTAPVRRVESRAAVRQETAGRTGCGRRCRLWTTVRVRGAPPGGIGTARGAR